MRNYITGYDHLQQAYA